MARWVDSKQLGEPVWSKLIDTLAAALWQDAEMAEAWAAAGLQPADRPVENKARLTWIGMVKEAHRAKKLVNLIEVVKVRASVAADDLQEVLDAEIEGGGWYASADPFAARLLGPRSLIDRSELTGGLHKLHEQGYKVLSIEGAPGSGRSHSGYLLQHVTDEPDMKSQLVWLDVEEEWPIREYPEGVDATMFARVLSGALGLSAVFDPDEHTQASRTSRELARDLLIACATLEPRARWIFIDGLDKPGVQQAVRELVNHLARGIDQGKLGDARLIVTGHSGDFPPRVVDAVAREPIDRIEKAHLGGFFKQIGDDVDDAIDDEECKKLVERVLERAPLDDLRELGAAVRDVAAERFGMP